MRAIWTGAISFGLVHVPVKALVATRQHRIEFNQLHGDDGEKIRYARMCPEHGEVPYEEIVKGHPLGRGEFVVVTKEELAQLEPEKSDTIDVEDFVLLSEIDPIYFDKAYHLIPDGGGGRPYRLLVEALKKTQRVAVGRFVMRNREHLVAIRTWQDNLVMELLYFQDEVVDPPEYDAKSPSKKEKEMAKKLVESLTARFDIKQYKDTHRKAVKELVEAKAEGHTVQVKERPKRSIRGLEKALEESLKAVAR